MSAPARGSPPQSWPRRVWNHPRQEAGGLPRWFRFILIAAISELLLIPCFWQPRIQAGDLSSHLYNAWMAGEIRKGSAPGLTLETLWTNVLGDWLLEILLNRAGAVWAERAISAGAVLIFFWGAFFLIRTANQRAPWRMTPILAMLGYGLIFHLGLLNYYLSTGLCFWLMALLWNPSRPRVLLALPLAAAAGLAHVVPLAWALAAAAYLWIAARLRPAMRLGLLGASLTALLMTAALIWTRIPARWSWSTLAGWNGILGVTGAEQVWLFGIKYIGVAAGLLAIWCWLLLARLDQRGLWGDPVVELWILHLIAFAALPSALQPEPYGHALAYIPQRISLFSAILVCVVTGGKFTGRGLTRLSAVLAALFFSFLYADTLAYNAAERDVAALLRDVAPGQRVIASIEDTGTRLSALMHVVDRACIGRCWSYANYEASTRQFRVQAAAPNPMVAWSALAVSQMEKGGYVVRPEEAPLAAVCACAPMGPRFCLRMLRAGEATCHLEVPVAPALWGRP